MSIYSTAVKRPISTLVIFIAVLVMGGFSLRYLPIDLYPEISGGQHRFTVRFLRWSGTGQRARQTDEDIEFLLALC